jgi:hypothetical protein
VEESVDIYPNPTNGEVKISINTNIDKRVTLMLLDAIGKVVYQKPVSLVNGNNRFQINLTKQASIKSGVYYFKVNGLDAIAIKEILITRD